jgi:hypothetical protein
MSIFQIVLGAAVALVVTAGARADDLVAVEQAAMAKLSFMDGAWRGPATTQTQSGPHSVTQTERIGPFLNGTVKMIEGRGYNPDGSVGFNALGIISFDPATQKYAFRSYAEGRAGTFSFEPTASGYVWEIPAGPMTIRYTAAIKDGGWHEEGARVLPGKDPVKFFEMNLKRVGNTDWPTGMPVPQK